MQTRNTVQRQIVLQTVQAMHDHPTADRVHESVVREHPSISKATVYRNLNQLAAQGMLRRVPVPNGADRYDFNLREHYHVRCTRCGAVHDVYLADTQDLIGRVEDASGASIEGFDLLFEGCCAACRKAESADREAM